MTEYDFSDEAYQNFMAKQARITRWLSHSQRTGLIEPDFPPTPLGTDENAPLPHSKERNSRLPRPHSPPPERSKSASRKRSRSMSARPPTPFEHTKDLPEPFVPTPELPEPGRPIYRFAWTPKPSKTPTPPLEPSVQYTGREIIRSSTAPAIRDSSQGFVSSREPTGSTHVRELRGLDSDRVRELHSPARKRSMSFSAAHNRPYDYSPQAHHHYHSNSPHHSSPHDYSSYYSSRNSSPYYTSASPGQFIPPPPAAGPAVGPCHPPKNFNHPFPHQQYPNYDAVRRHEPTRSYTVPTHTAHCSFDSSSYAQGAPAYSYDQTKPVQHIRQHHSNSLPVSPTTGRHPSSMQVTFPNGKTLHMNLPNADRSEILKHPDRYQVPPEYYKSPSQKKPLLQRLFSGFGKSHGGSSTKSSGTKSGRSSPTRRKARNRSCSIG